jgi:hypothetical protein
MSKTAITSQLVTITGDGLVYTDGPDPLTNNAAIPPGSQALINGANTVTIPVGALAVKIKPPQNNTFVLTLKGVSGDTGLPISKVAPTTWVFDVTPPASFVINSTGSVTVGLIWG